MAIVQDKATFVEMANSVGIYDELAETIHDINVIVTPPNVIGLTTICNEVGLYDEKADHLVEAGVTFA